MVQAPSFLPPPQAVRQFVDEKWLLHLQSLPQNAVSWTWFASLRKRLGRFARGPSTQSPAGILSKVVPPGYDQIVFGHFGFRKHMHCRAKGSHFNPPMIPLLHFLRPMPCSRGRNHFSRADPLCPIKAPSLQVQTVSRCFSQVV